MKSVILALAVAAGTAVAQQSAYEQCGGSDWSGATACVAGYECVAQNPYYSQCVAGSASASTSKATTTTLKTSVKTSGKTSFTTVTTTKAATTTKAVTTTKATTTVKATTTTKAATTTAATTATTTPVTTAAAAAADATTICGQWDTATVASYTLYQDLWNEDEGTGSQCSTLDGVSGDDVSWSTSWSWATNSDQVKSYANVVTAFTSKQLSALTSIPTTWKYSYTGTSIVADVSYDMFTSSTAGGSNEYEIMVWLAALGGAGPISSTGSTVATPTIAGSTWKLYSGNNGVNNVFSFVADTEITSFSGDLIDFLDYLTTNEGLPTTQYLTSIGAGTEPFTGSDAVLTVSSYSCSVA